MRLWAVLLVAGSAVSSAMAGDLVAPGMWQSATAMYQEGKGMRVLNSSSGCLVPEQARTWEAHAREMMAASGCNGDNLRIGGGKISGVAHCQTESMRVSWGLRGTYSDKAYNVDAYLADRPNQAVLNWSGKRLGSC